MPRAKKDSYLVLTPKNDGAKNKLGYHGEKWVLRKEIETVSFSREKNWLVLMSRNGEKCIYVLKENDPDFDIRTI